jgi:N-acetylneuraminate synthase/N,N'-diacetyllegionaminate synthase
MSVYIIAEAGSCHDGDFRKAIDLVLAAEKTGADAVKFQFWSSSHRMRDRRHITEPLTEPSSYFKEMIFREWLPEIQLSAHKLDMDFMCTAYLPEDIVTVAKHVDKFKISSFESQDQEFVRAHLPYKKEIIVSLGMRGEELIVSPYIKYLHCVSAYPTPIGEANIAAVAALDGLSDHTRSLLSGALAVAYGATIIEKHLRLDTTEVSCPDYPHSLSPRDFSVYVQNIREAEQLIGDGDRRVMPSEAPNRKHRAGNV